MAQAKEPRSRVELLWQDVQPPSRGPKPKLTVWLIAEKAIAIADTDGIDAVSMQRVAKELGYTTMSLYRYVQAKDELLEVMFEVAAGTPPEYTGEPADWRTEAEAWIEALWDMYWRHPWAARVAIQGAPSGPNQLAWLEAGLRPLARAGLPDEDLVSVVLFLLGSVRQLAAIAIDIVTARQAAGVSAAEAEAGYEATLREYVTSERFPNVARLTAAGIFGPSGELGEVDAAVGLDLRFGVRRMLDGIEAYIRR